MSTFLKTVFQPISNRHFTDKKTSFIVYIVKYIPITLILIFLSIFVNPRFALILVITVAIALLDYLLFDALTDKISWKLFWSRFYDEKQFQTSDEHAALKAFEKNPSEENRIALENHLRVKS